MNKLIKFYEEKGIFMSNFTKRNSLNNIINEPRENQPGRTSELTIYNKYKDSTINAENDLKHGIDKYNEMNYEDSQEQESE